MRHLVHLATISLFAASVAFAAEQTWTGTISDSDCGASHQSAIEHSGKKISDAECTAACVKAGAKYVFVHDGKVYRIENQDFPALSVHGGHGVRLTGEMTGDSIKVAKIEMPEKKAAS